MFSTSLKESSTTVAAIFFLVNRQAFI